MARSAARDEDAVLLRECRLGRREAFRALFDRHRERIFHVVCRLVDNKEDALDLTQETFVRAFASLPRFREEASFKTYLTRIAVNACVDFGRRSKRPEVPLDEARLETGGGGVEAARAADGDPLQAAESGELQEALRRAVARLPEAQRTTFLLYAVEGLTYREVAEALGVAVGTVMSRIYYARRTIQDSLGPFLSA